MPSTNTVHCLLALSRIPGLGESSLRALARALLSGVSWEELLADPLPHLRGNRREAVAKELRENLQPHLEAAEQMLRRCGDEGIEVRCMTDADYPARLLDLADPPVLLFSRGDFRLLSRMKGAAVIGARESTAWGDGVARQLARALVRHGYNVVSGLALGIDTAAHRGALEAGGRTTAAVVDVVDIYPPRNAELAEEIVRSGGLMIAENPPGTSATGPRLVARDRIQSGLSVAVFPIETGITGGTVHTLRFAAAQGRPVFCLDPEELRTHSTPAFHEGIAKVVREGAGVYRVEEIEKATSSI